MIRTQDYFFILENYDPELGRFIQPDPKHQTTSPYLYAGNNPMMYVDPDGQFFFIDDALIWGALAAAAHGAAIAAAVSVTVQYTTTGQVNWDEVGSAALGGAIGAGLFNTVGSTFISWDVDKVLVHAAVGGIQSSIMGGSFWSGAIGAGAGEMASPFIMGGAQDDLGRIAGAAVVGGTAAWASGGSFYQGALAGGFGMAFNELGHSMSKKSEWHDTREKHSPQENMEKTIGVLKKVYNASNEVFHSQEVYLAAKTYIAVSTYVPELWPTVPFVAGYVSYQEALLPGAQFREWK